jgi:hypothetical protein
VEKHVNKSWEKELEGAETYCQTQEKTEGTHRQLMFLMERSSSSYPKTLHLIAVRT